VVAHLELDVLENALDLEILDRGFGCLADDVLLGFQMPRGPRDGQVCR
jgi:hypothetical protein